MKALRAFALLGLLLPVGLFAQSNEEKRDAKLAEDWLQNADWLTDYDQAREVSAETGKPIFAYFTRSYAF